MEKLLKTSANNFDGFKSFNVANGASAIDIVGEFTVEEPRVISVAFYDKDMYPAIGVLGGGVAGFNLLPANVTLIGWVQYGSRGGIAAVDGVPFNGGALRRMVGSYCRASIQVVNNSGAQLVRNLGCIIGLGYMQEQALVSDAGPLAVAGGAVSGMTGIAPFVKEMRVFSNATPFQIEFYDTTPALIGPAVAGNGDSGWVPVPVAQQYAIRNTGGAAGIYRRYLRT